METTAQEPFERFAELYAQALAQVPKDPTSMILATVGADGAPSARVVLLKGHDERGFTFYTNNLSRKGRELGRDPRAALVFFWPQLNRQIRVEGRVVDVPEAESDAYFASRARPSQLGAWASLQSQHLEAPEILAERMEALETRYQGQEVPRPPHWGGHRLQPTRIEFWEDRPGRLHVRELYTRERPEGPWERELLYP